jgi:hypothetical protein
MANRLGDIPGEASGAKQAGEQTRQHWQDRQTGAAGWWQARIFVRFTAFKWRWRAISECRPESLRGQFFPVRHALLKLLPLDPEQGARTEHGGHLAEPDEDKKLPEQPPHFRPGSTGSPADKPSECRSGHRAACPVCGECSTDARQCSGQNAPAPDPAPVPRGRSC